MFDGYHIGKSTRETHIFYCAMKLQPIIEEEKESGFFCEQHYLSEHQVSFPDVLS